MTELNPAVSAKDHQLGGEHASLTLVEYSDFQCPYCRTAHGILPRLARVFGHELRIVYRHFPLVDMHAHAELAAQAAECAGAQGAFWQMHDALFDNQERLGLELFVELAYALGLDEDRFLRDLRIQRYLPRVRRDLMSGEQSGVQGTPTFFINGRKHRGAWDEESLRMALKSAMPKSRAG